MIIVFIRQALLDNSIRLDGRGVDDYRELSIQLERQRPQTGYGMMAEQMRTNWV